MSINYGFASASGARDAVGWRLWVASPVSGARILPVSEHTAMVYEQILSVVRRGERDLRRGVLPRDVVARLPYRRAEGTVRRDMSAMWALGILERVGGEGCRRGYRVSVRYRQKRVA
jgi:hypothetical protein